MNEITKSAVALALGIGVIASGTAAYIWYEKKQERDEIRQEKESRNQIYNNKLDQIETETKRLKQELEVLLDVKPCDPVELKDGKYDFEINGHSVVYTVKNSGKYCEFWLYSGSSPIYLEDKGCDKTVNRVWQSASGYTSRNKLTEWGLVERADKLSEKTQQYVCSTHKVRLNIEKNIDEALVPFE